MFHTWKKEVMNLWFPPWAGQSLGLPDFLPCLLPSKPWFMKCSKHIKIKMARRHLRTGILSEEHLSSHHALPPCNVFSMQHSADTGRKQMFGRRGVRKGAHTFSPMSLEGLKPLSPVVKTAAEVEQSFSPSS